MNVDKTEILLLGNTNENDIPKKYRHQIKSELKSLGLILGTEQTKNLKANYEGILGKMKATLDKWN